MNSIKKLKIASPSKMKKIALEEKEREVTNEIEEALKQQIIVIKKAMKNYDCWCPWISFDKYHFETKKEVRKIIAEAGYTITPRTISWI